MVLCLSMEGTNMQFDELEKRLKEIKMIIEDQNDWIGVVIGRFQRRPGKSLEEAIAGTLRASLRRRDIKPENLTLRKKIKDEDGIIGPKDRTYEIDLYIHDSESIVFEIKSYVELEDILRFNDKAELAIEKIRLSNPLKVMVSLEKSREITNLCEEVGIMLV